MISVVLSNLNGSMKNKSSYDISGKALYFLPAACFLEMFWLQKENIYLTTFGVLSARHSILFEEKEAKLNPR